MPAVVLGFDTTKGVYQLDVHPSADPQKIRRTDDVFRGVPLTWEKSDDVMRFETGDRVEYFRQHDLLRF